MASLKSELDEYLNKGQKNKPNNGHVHIPKALKKLFNSETGEQTENLLAPTRKTYFDLPSLVSYVLIRVSWWFSGRAVDWCLRLSSTRVNRVV